MKKWIIVGFGVLALQACSRNADVVSQNLSTEADNFHITRRIVFYNGITGEYMLKMEGLCSIGSGERPREVTITCKTGPAEYKKNFLGLSDNVTFFAEQIDPSTVSTYHYEVVFKPSTIIPHIEPR